jgi:hypothetical protein
MGKLWDEFGISVLCTDCERFADVCKAFGVEGYPTIMLLKPQKTADGLGFAPVRPRTHEGPSALLPVTAASPATVANPVTAASPATVASPGHLPWHAWTWNA